MKRKYVDLCLKIDGRVRLLVEAKAAGKQLRERYVEQAERYASENNYPWVVLTNGADWHLYHLTFEDGIEYEGAFAVDLGDEEGLEDTASKLALLHKRAISRGELDAFWERATALGFGSIGKALFQDAVIMPLRREIHHQTGILIDREDLAKAVHEMLSTEAREQIGPLRILTHRKPKKPKTIPQESPDIAGQAEAVSAAPTAEPKLGT